MIVAGFWGFPAMFVAEFVGAAFCTGRTYVAEHMDVRERPSRDKTQRHHLIQKGVVHGESLCGNKADRREKGVAPDPFFTKAAIPQRDSPCASPTCDQVRQLNQNQPAGGNSAIVSAVATIVSTSYEATISPSWLLTSVSQRTSP